MNVDLNKKEIELINEACEWWMDEVKENSTFENPNNKKFYELWDIRNKLKAKKLFFYESSMRILSICKYNSRQN